MLFFAEIKPKIKPFFIKTLIFAVFIFVFFGVGVSEARASHCTDYPFSAYGSINFFADFEEVEYVDHLLVIHLKINESYVSYNSYLRTNYSFLDDECKGVFGSPYNIDVSLSPGVRNFSIRFSSSTHFDIWNDDTNTKEFCAGCSQDVPELAGYNEFFLHTFLIPAYGNGQVRTTPYRIRDDSPDAPVQTSTLPAPIGCRAMYASGYLFDNYERAEYLNGFLTLHFRFLSPYNDGRFWFPNLFLYDANCEVIDVTGSPAPGISITPHVRYFSARFTSPTHYDIWNDETGMKETCDLCSVDVSTTLRTGESASFVSFVGLIDAGNNSHIVSTPFPIAEPSAKPNPVIIIPGILGSAEKNGVWMIDPIFHTYDDLISTLKANGYTEGLDLFTFPYDWHLSNVETALKLRDKINDVQGICDCAKVDLVAHSMGGLVSREYIQSGNYENDVDQLIFLGTPHLGAPKAYLMWEGGELNLSIEDMALKFILLREAKKTGFSSLFDYVRNKPIPSVQQLLPIYDYLFDGGTLRDYPNNYPENSFLENLKNSLNLLSDSGVEVTNIIGDAGDASTLHGINVIQSDQLPLWEYGKPESLNFGFGDGTVPYISSAYIADGLTIYPSTHSKLPTDAEEVVFKKLTNKDATVIIDNGFSVNLKLLIIKILSPADIQVIAPNEKRVGKDFETGEEINEIPGAFYSGFLTDDEYITIPNPLDGEYIIKTMGTGSGGEYTIAAGYVSNDSLIEKDFTAQTQPDLIENLNVEVNNANPEALSVMPEDTTPPEIIVASPLAQDYLRSAALPINVNIQDIETGVASSTIMFDGKIIDSVQSIDLFFETLGAHKLRVLASDLVGNTDMTEVNLRVIATRESTISDIQRAYSLGWIMGKEIKEDLIEEFNESFRQKKKSGKNLGKSFLKELDKYYKKKRINDQAYNLLKEDINWLLNNS